MASIKTYIGQVSQSIPIYYFQLTHFREKKICGTYHWIFILLVNVSTVYATDQINF